MAPKDRLLERDSVLAELDRHQQATARGHGRVVLLRGEAGVGKTAVITRFIARVGQRTRVLRGWCDPLSAPRPLGPLIDMLADTSGELRAAVDAGDTAAIYAGLVGMFGNQPGVCVIEDAHWADGATLDVMRFIARRIDALPLLFVVSYRDDEIGDQHPLAVLLGDLATSAAICRIGLDPLSPAAVAELAAGSGVNAEALHRLTRGNAFYVTEVLAAGQDVLTREALPGSVSEAVRGRLARLSAAGRDTAYATAVCGPRASLELVREVCPTATEGLAECLNAGVLVADVDTVGFRHELARRAALDQIAPYQRRLLHKQALAILTQPPSNPDTFGALAFHAEQAGDHDAVIGYAPLAAERAFKLAANREAADLFALALRYADRIPTQQKVVWLEQHAFACWLSAMGEAAVASWREAITLRHGLGDRLGEGRDLSWLSQMVYALGGARGGHGLCSGARRGWAMSRVGPIAGHHGRPGGGRFRPRQR